MADTQAPTATPPPSVRVLVTDVLPSAHFPQAQVIVTNCGHRHVRPIGMYHVNDGLWCPFCEPF